MSAAKRNGSRLHIQTESDEEGFVKISVEDNGPGMGNSIEDKAFDPFFTTKENGLGMGLPIYRSITEVQNGHLYHKTLNSGDVRFECALPGLKGMRDGV